MRIRSTIKTQNGINWYYEQEGSGPHVVLIPDGFGDCQMFDKPMSLIANEGFTVTSFDTPGMSRSYDAPADAYQDVTAQKLAGQVISLADALDIEEAAYWGSSSGGAAVLALAAGYPDRVRNGLVHEVPTQPNPALEELLKLDDETLAKVLEGIAVNSGLVDEDSWATLGEEVHARLSNNYLRWFKGYQPLSGSVSTAPDDLLQRPLDWTVGDSTPTSLFLDNILTAGKLDIPCTVLPGRHFPYVSHPETMGQYVVDTCLKYLP